MIADMKAHSQRRWARHRLEGERVENAMTDLMTPKLETVVLHVGGLHYASEKAVVEQVLGRRPGVISVEANPVAQTASVVYDRSTTTVAALRRWVRDCGYHR